MTKPLCIDLFCGYGGWARGFLDAGYRVIGFDNELKCAKRYTGEFVLADVRTLDGTRFRGARVIVASPPCQGFSVARIGVNWTQPPDNRPKTEKAVQAVELVKETLRIIHEAEPESWFIENPVGKLRSLGIVPGVHKTITQCQYGGKWRKPTDLWGTFDFGTYLKEPCHNGDPCHEEAKRGAKTGVQGVRDPNERAFIPYGLARAIAEACKP